MDELTTTSPGAIQPQDFRSWLREWGYWLDLRVQANEISKATATSYRRGAERYFAFVGGSANLQTNAWENGNPADPDTIRVWKAELLDKFKPRSVNVWLAGVKSFFGWLAEKHRVPFDPTQLVKSASRKGMSKKHVRETLTDNEIRRVLAMPDTETPTGARDAAILYVMAYTAVRTVEIHRADLADLKTRDGRLTLAVQGKGSREKDDFVIIPPDAEPVLQDWLAVRGKKPGPLFTSASNRTKGARLSLSYLREMVMGYFKLAGVTGNKSTHSLRHTAITKMIRAGVPPVKVMSVSRHASVDTLMIYVHDVDRMDDPAENHISY